MTNPVPKLSRRTLLRATSALGGAATVGTVGWLATAAGPAFAKTPAGLSGPAATAGRGLLALARDMDGRLLLPGDDGFGMASTPNNGHFAHLQPRAVALCTTPADVQRCLRWATQHGMPFAVRSGGHSYAGFSTTPGLLISVRHLRGVVIDKANGTVTIQGGVNNQDMADVLRNHGVAVPSGRCPTVGASGLVLGGGWGFAATRSGLTCDSLLTTDVVLANSRLVQASSQQQPDLFWAARGGGGGNFGVHTAFTFKLHEVGTVTKFNIVWQPGKQVELLQALQALQLQNPRSLSTRSKARPQKAGALPNRSDMLVESLGLYWGGKVALRELFAPLLSMQPTQVLDIQELPYWEARDQMVTDDPSGLYELRSSYVGQSISADGLDTMLSWMGKWPGGSLLQENMGLFFAIGGAVNAVAVDATAYAHRDSSFIFEQEAMWSPLDRPDVVRRQREWLAAYYQAMQPYLQQRSYVNFPDRSMKDWAKRYYGSNLARLSRVKRQYDPHNTFRFAQSIPLAQAF